MSRYTRDPKQIAAVSIGTLAAATMTGCNNDYDNWMTTDGAAGRINMGDVQKALESSKDPSAFEQRVNEIYEGKNLVLVKVDDLGNGQKKVSGYEDLNGNKQLDASGDDLLFSAVVGEKDYDLKGAGVNSYYSHRGGFTMTDMLLMHWMMSSTTRVYVTSPARATQLGTQRSTYRSSTAFTRQKTSNSSFTSKAKAANPQAFKSASSKVSSSRSSYQRTQQRSFKSTSRSSSRGGFRGGA